MQQTVEYDDYIFTVLYDSMGIPAVYQEAKGYFGAKWLSVDKVPSGKEGLVEKINAKFETSFVVNNGNIELESLG